MSTTFTTVVVGTDAAEVFGGAKARVHTYDNPDAPELSGHIAMIEFASVVVQCSGDGARTLTEGLREMADKVEAAHREWLQAAAARENAAPVFEVGDRVHHDEYGLGRVTGHDNVEPELTVLVQFDNERTARFVQASDIEAAEANP